MDADTVCQIEQLPRGRIGDAWRESLVLNPSRFVAEFLRRKSYSKPAVAREETSSQDPNIEVQTLANLHDDLLYQIFMLLPSESLFRLKFVCKQWFCLINSSIFVTSHAQKSETVLISQQMASWRRGCAGKPKAYFHLLSLDGLRSSFVESSVDDLGSVRASYDGLVVTTNVQRKISKLMNPMTGRYVDLPLGILCNHRYESFGIAFCSEAKTYKVVRLFPGGFKGSVHGIWTYYCEILTVETRKWRRIEGLSLPLRLEEPLLSVGGSLHLLGSGDCFFSLDVRDEKFVTKKLPVEMEWEMKWNCKLVEIGGDLGFVYPAEVDALEVWVLSELRGECWIKRCRIDLRADLGRCILVCCTRDGSEMVLEYSGGLCVYDFGRDETRLITSGSSGGGGDDDDDDDNDDDDDDDKPCLKMMNSTYIPHSNTLVSCGEQRVIPLIILVRIKI